MATPLELKDPMLHNFIIILILLLVLIGVFTLGLVIPPRPYRKHPAPSQPGEPTPLRPDLPEPVRRHFVETIGETPPIMETAVVWGRGKACIRGVWVPFRFRGWYRSGEAFLRRMEVTWFQRPVLRGIDSWINGRGLFEMAGRVESGERIDQGQVLSMWADAVWMPSVFVHDPNIRWEPVDDHTARLVVPYKGGTLDLDAHFDPATGRMTHLSALRYSDDAGDSGDPVELAEKEPWRSDLLEWKEINGLLVPTHIDDAWGEVGSPTSYWLVDGIAYNVNVTEQLGQRTASKQRRGKKAQPA
jgi:hypothetical protein